MKQNLQPHHHAAHKHYVQKTKGQGKTPKPWLHLTQSQQQHALQDLTDLINKTQNHEPPITIDTLHTIQFNTQNHKQWVQKETKNAPRPTKKKKKP